LVDHAKLNILFRIITSRPLNALTSFAVRDGARRFAGLLPRELLDGMNTFFFRDAISNIDLDGDGREESFLLTVTNGWFEQRITGVLMFIDGRRVPSEEVLLRGAWGEARAGDIMAVDFPPGGATEIIAVGRALGDGIHFIDLTVDMELVPMIMPGLPVQMRGGRGDFAVFDDPPWPAWPPVSVRPGVAHLVPHVHYDIEWLKTRDVFERVGAGNLLEALRLMEEDPSMTFVTDQVPQLEPFRRSNPEAFDRLVSLAREGRVEPANGMYGEPDVNLVSGESLVRQSVAWQRYALDTFSRTSDCGWLIDSFGMSAQLPQILSKSGTPYLAFSRSRVPGAPTEFQWEGIDGSRILAVNMPRLYNAGHPVPADLERAMKKMLKSYSYLRESSATDQVFYPAGIDHGRPQAHGEAIRAWNDRVDGVSFRFSLPSRFFESLDRNSLPVVKGEFVGELWGTYSSRSGLKRAERACEFALLDAGKLATLAWLQGAHFPSEGLEAAWRTLMDCQFHDQICGCCTDEVAGGMDERYREVAGQCRLVGQEAASHIVGRTGEDNFTAFVFNPLSRPVRSPVELVLDLPPGWPAVSVTGPDGPEPSQLIDATRYGDGTLQRATVLIVPSLPATGCAVFEVAPPAEGAAESALLDIAPAAVDGTVLRNGELEVTLDSKTGLIESVTAGGRRFSLRGANRLTLETELGNLYESYGLRDTRLHPMKVERVVPAETGPLRSALLVEGTIGKTAFSQKLMLTAGARRIDIETRVVFADPGMILGLRFPTGMAGGSWTHEIPYGCIERSKGEERPAQNFVDLSRGGQGVTLINDGIPSNRLRRGTIDLTLLRSTDKIYFWDAGPGALELGEHLFRYALYPHAGDWRSAGSVLEAYSHNDRPVAFIMPGSPAGTRETPGALESSSEHALVSALEIREDGLVMVRVWESAGEGRTVELRFSAPVEQAQKCDLLEREGPALPVDGETVTLELGPFEIATVLVSI